MTIIIIIDNNNNRQWYIIIIIVNLKKVYQLIWIATQWTHLLIFFIFINYIYIYIKFKFFIDFNRSDVTSFVWSFL